jgi:hypothetical protein
LPFETEVMICTGQDVMTMASADPFGNEPIPADVVRFVSVLSRRSRKDSGGDLTSMSARASEHELLLTRWWG